MSIRQVLNQASKLLDSRGIVESRLDAQVLLAHVLNITRSELLAHLDDPLQIHQRQELDRLLARRINREPVAYITGHKEFYDLDFSVTPATLIPRPETELLVETAIQTVNAGRGSIAQIIDIGTGCGAIGVSLAFHLPTVEVIATDISSAALEVARKNAIRHKVIDRISFFQGDLLTPFRGRFDLIIANLPYVTDAQFQELDDDVKEYEPVHSLKSGCSGFESIDRLLWMAGDRLSPTGTILLEIGYQQGEAVKESTTKYFPECHIDIKKDLGGNDRVVKIKLLP